MASPIDILLITGFLGSGKSTFLNFFLEQLPRDRNIAVLMNEFGEIGIDGALLQGDDFELVEISRGSIFCICVKTDYIKAMHRIAYELRPDLLIIETTGVADPSDMGRDLQLGVFRERFRLLDQVCIIDPTSFPDLLEIYTSIEKQVKSSRIFVLNKIDIAQREAVKKSIDLIRGLNPGAAVFETSYGQVPLQMVLPAALLAPQPAVTAQPPPEAGSPLGGQELDALLDEIFLDRSRVFSPPDALLSEVVVWTGGSYTEFSKGVQDLPAGILRSKGFVKFGDKVKLFNRTMGCVSIDDIKDLSISDALINKLIVIYPHDTAAAVDAYLQRQCLFKRLPGSLKDNRLIQFGLTQSIRGR